MINKKLMASLLVGAATLIGTALPTPALASNNNAALNMMAMQMYMQQQSNAQTQAILAQEQAQATYNAAQAAWAANTIPPAQTVVSYCSPSPVYVQTPQVNYVSAPRMAYRVNHDFHQVQGSSHRDGRR